MKGCLHQPSSYVLSEKIGLEAVVLGIAARMLGGLDVPLLWSGFAAILAPPHCHCPHSSAGSSLLGGGLVRATTAQQDITRLYLIPPGHKACPLLIFLLQMADCSRGLLTKNRRCLLHNFNTGSCMSYLNLLCDTDSTLNACVDGVGYQQDQQ